MNRPDRRNALNRDMLMRLGDAVNESATDGHSAVLILKGRDAGVFCSGGDLKELEPGRDFGQFVKAIEYFQKSLWNYPFPAIAMIRGHAIGLGLDMATLCDIRLSGETAWMGANAVRLGKVYHDASAKRLIDIVGYGAATELLITGRLVDARRAEKIGLVHQVYPDDLLEEKTFDLAKEIVRSAVPDAVRGTKSMLKKLRGR
jgi:enoyl-CoA hydratase/carnithine racemase